MTTRTRDTKLYEAKHGEIDSRTFILFIQTADAVLKYADKALNKAGLSLIKQMVLQLLQAHGGTLTPSEIASLTLRERHDITTLLQRLDKSKLIELRINPTDRRSKYVTITDKGKQALKFSAPTSRSIVKQVMSSIPDSKTEVLKELLTTLRLNAYNGLRIKQK